MATLEPIAVWRCLCDQIQHPDVELTVEEFAALLSVYKLLRAEGHQFEIGTVALMTVLERQAAETIDGFEDDTDTDEDDSDRTLNLEWDPGPKGWRFPVNPGDGGRGVVAAKAFAKGAGAARKRVG